VGLLVPSSRSEGGHRVYSDADVRRLYRIVALRGLGLPLDGIARALDGPSSDLTDVVRTQLARLESEVAEAERLRARLAALLDALERSGGVASDEDVIQTIEVMTMYYTPEQLEELERRRAELGDEGMRAAEAEWESVASNLTSLMNDGVDVADPRVQAEIERSNALIASFTGGNPGIHAGLNKMWQDQDPEELSRGLFTKELFEFMGRARAVRGEQASS
jgi:DNA-binding transcriptional MerR regulator